MINVVVLGGFQVGTNVLALRLSARNHPPSKAHTPCFSTREQDTFQSQ